MPARESLLVRWRGILAAIMAAVAIVCGLMIPGIRINDDLTSSLPDDSPMREGLAILAQDFPGLDIRVQTLRVLFLDETPADTLQTAIESIIGEARMDEVRQHGSRTLYQYRLPRDADGAVAVAAVRERFGARVQVELDDNKGMPDHIPLMIGTGFMIIFMILLLMCSSFFEPLLYLATFGIAILIGMGTNALLPGVTLITHSLAAVLQLALSIDYAIILMNRYRQERQPGIPLPQAMSAALSKATPSILGSSMTTIVSLLMLCFMRLKIGADLGIVLSKGVLCSLLVTYTVLPALILLCDKLVFATQKRVPDFPMGGLARTEWRFRIPLVLLFTGLFSGAWFLQHRTEMSYSVSRGTAITREFPPRNQLLILYPTAEEIHFLSLAEELADDPVKVSCISYPTIMMQPRTANEWTKIVPKIAESVPRKLLDLLYYATAHPRREERMRLDELEPIAREFLQLTGSLVPDISLPDIGSRFDTEAFSIPETPFPVKQLPEPLQQGAKSGAAPIDTAAVTFPEEDLPGGQADSVAVPLNELDRMGLDYSYGQITRERTLAEMSSYLPVDARYIRLVYRMSGRSGRAETMSACDFMTTVSEKVLQNKLYSSRISEETRSRLEEVKRIFDAVMVAGPEPVVAQEDDGNEVVSPEENPISPATEIPQAEEAEDPAPADPLPEMTPAEVLAELALSGKRCTASQCFRTLRQAGVSVSRDEIDMIYLYYGFRSANDTTLRLSLQEVTACLDHLLTRPVVTQYLNPGRVAQLDSLRQSVEEGLDVLRGNRWSVAVITSDLPEEGAETFSFIQRLRKLCDDTFSGRSLLVGYSVMYDEMASGFSRELLIVTLLTILAIFLIVAFTFRSPVIPFLLVSTVLTAVWLAVSVTGLTGRPMLYISYLVLQSVLMGATIDYSILLTNYYREARQSQDPAGALATAYRGAIHTILTSGLILTLGPWIMTCVISDPILVPILRSISLGALFAVLLILFLLPSLLVLLDRLVSGK